MKSPSFPRKRESRSIILPSMENKFLKCWIPASAGMTAKNSVLIQFLRGDDVVIIVLIQFLRGDDGVIIVLIQFLRGNDGFIIVLIQSHCGNDRLFMVLIQSHCGNHGFFMVLTQSPWEEDPLVSGCSISFNRGCRSWVDSFKVWSVFRHNRVCFRIVCIHTMPQS